MTISGANEAQEATDETCRTTQTQEQEWSDEERRFVEESGYTSYCSNQWHTLRDAEYRHIQVQLARLMSVRRYCMKIDIASLLIKVNIKCEPFQICDIQAYLDSFSADISRDKISLYEYDWSMPIDDDSGITNTVTVDANNDSCQ
jgi:hypothetical protein